MKDVLKSFDWVKIALVVLVIWLSILLVSCGTRKVETNKIQKDSITETTIEAIKFTDVNLLTFKPFDNLKPMVINGKSYMNVIISNDKSKIKEIVKYRNITKTITITKIKQTEKSDYTFMIIGLAALVLIALKFKLLSFGNN